MKGKELKKWLDELPEEYMECNVYFHETGRIEDGDKIYVKHTPIWETTIRVGNDGMRIGEGDVPTILLGAKIFLDENK